MNGAQIAEALGGKKSGAGWACKCLSHEDDHASLSISELNGKILVKCHAGCEQDEVIAALLAKNLWPETSAKKKIVATYDYVDAAGTLLYQAVRYEPKEFRQRRPDGKGGWIWNLQIIKRVIYNLPTVLKAVKVGENVFIVEGEKDVAALAKIGLTATTNASGAGKWRKEYSVCLKGAKAIILPDNDDPGRAHAQQVAQFLAGVAAEVKIIELPGLPPKGDASDWIANGGNRDELQALCAKALSVRQTSATPMAKNNATPNIEKSIDGAELLGDVHDFIRRFVAFPSPTCLDTVTLWAAHAHGIEYFHTTPRLAALSPEPESGKTRVLELLDLLTPNAMLVFSPSVAAIFRKLAQNQVTLLFDEVDTIFTKRGKDDQNEDLRALLNAGYRRGASIPRCVGPKHDVQDFKVFAAVALAGIGDLPDTVMTRSIVIKMRRRSAHEHIEQYRVRVHEEEGHALRDRLALWVESIGPAAGEAWPELPAGVVDRRAEAWEPLIAIADQAGGVWPDRARVAAVADVAAYRGRETSLGIKLLIDLRHLFSLGGREKDAVSTSEILERLNAMEESPWGDLRGKPLDSRGLAMRLRRYGVTSKTVRLAAATPKGYTREDLHDAWQRYLPSHPHGSATSATSETSAAEKLESRPDSSSFPNAGAGCVGDPALARETSETGTGPVEVEA